MNGLSEVLEALFCNNTDLISARKSILALIKKQNNELAMKLTHEHTRNQGLEKKLSCEYNDCSIMDQDRLKVENEKYKKIVEIAKEIKRAREEHRGNIDSEAFYYFAKAVVEIIDSKLNQALKGLE